MVFSKKLADKKLILRGVTFDLSKIYKNLREKLKSMGYLVTEKEHEFKPTQYGNDVTLTFVAVRGYDDFGKIDTELDFKFKNVKNVKNLQNGNLVLLIKPQLTLDYKNKWGTTKFNKFLFNLYLRVFKNELKIKYFVTVIKETGEVYDFIKDLLDEYKH